MTKNIFYVLGVVFVILGLLGFVNNPVLGLFEVNALLNIIHLVTGILLLVYAGKPESTAKTLAVVLGVIYALVAVLGFLMGGNVLGLFHVNGAHNVLHLILAIVFLAVGLTGRSSSAPSMPAGPAMQI